MVIHAAHGFRGEEINGLEPGGEDVEDEVRAPDPAGVDLSGAGKRKVESWG